MTKTDWTAEAVRAAAMNMEADETFKCSAEDCQLASDMLTAFAERIEADERAVPVAVVSDAEWGKRLTWLANGGKDLPPVGTKLFTRPPAQPAQEQPGWNVPYGLYDAVREAAEILQMVADSGVPLPPNWRWPIADELSGFAYLLMDVASPTPPKEK